MTLLYLKKHILFPYTNIHISRSVLTLITGIFFYIIALSIMALNSPENLYSMAFSESGFFEQGAKILWLVAGFISLYLWVKRNGSISGLLFSFFFFLCYARESDLHKAYTSMSILKPKFYLDGMGQAEWISLPIALLSICLFISVAVYIVKYFITRNGFHTSSGQIVFFAAGGMVMTKFFDRFPDIFDNMFGYELPIQIYYIMLAIEEGVECLIPILFILAMFSFPNFLKMPSQKKTA